MSTETPQGPGQNNTVASPGRVHVLRPRHISRASGKSFAARKAAQECRDELRQRLEEEGETKLAASLEKCAIPFKLTCSHCGNCKEVESGCRQKWCPVCQRAVAAKRTEKYRDAVAKMSWPLFVTLTTPPHEECDLKNLKRLKKGFSKFRRKKIWTDRVTGAVCGFEINSKSGRFHAHLHLVCDCKWLAHFTPMPQKGDTKSRVKERCMSASQELGIAWAKCLGVPYDPEGWSGTIYKVKRTDPDTITSEVLKYCVKGSDLLNSKHPIGDVIRAIQGTRLTSSYGSCYGKGKPEIEKQKQPRPCECCGVEAWVTDFEVEPEMRKFRDQARQRGLVK